MYKFVFSAVAVALLLMGGLTACKNQKKSDDILVSKYVPETVKGPIAMTADSLVSDAEWLDKHYSILIRRVPAREMPLLVDERGQEYVDNRIMLSIFRADGSVFLTKEFTKESFASYIEDGFRKKGILETIVFHTVDNNQLKFGAVVSRPDNEDLFVPLDLWIDRMGELKVKPGNLFDAAAGEE